MSVDFNNFPGSFTRLTLSGGGPRGLAILGGLHYIHEHGGLNSIEEYWGTSVGSVIGLLLLVGYTPFEAFHQFFMLDHIADPTYLNIQTLVEETAFCPIELFGDKIRHLIEKKLGPGANPTFLELYQRFGKKIHIIGANTNTMSGDIFDVDTRPQMKVIDAVEISCDLPYIFTKKHFEGQIYVDGGFINNYAVNLADNGIDYGLGICVFGDMTTGISDYVGWIYRLLYMPIMELHRERISRLSSRFTNIELTVNNLSMLEMSPSRKKKNEVFTEGYKQTRAILLEMEQVHCVKSAHLNYTPSPVDHGWEWELDWDLAD